MLEVKNLSKIYKSKTGTDVKALDDVSVSFPESGMVFLLGKSGSGKSTLLNICGGLDSPTIGEIIVKGRSSKNFSQSDFDSYRNTFIGFIFQEYNILNEFSVEDNIALALELQNKPKNKATIEKLLSDVDLAGFAKRKPNTLSGGQKQRIAIARALVKNPEIIMADEPSGALDSATGKQVFETLKKLSKDKLVIVVSHDRDFAQLYGDRIIELSDGKIISDVSKSKEKQVSVTKNIDSMGNVLCIKQGKSLDEEDFSALKNFLKNTDGDVIIASGEKEVDTFKKANRITENGEREVFAKTTLQEKKSYRPEDSKFIRSRLPLRHAIKIGFSGLKSKPVRLFFTILLCTAAFMLFGLLSTMSFYNNEKTFKQTMKDSDDSVIRLEKNYLVETKWYNYEELYSSYTFENQTFFTPDEVEEYKNRYGKDVFSGADNYLNYNVVSAKYPYWSNIIKTFAYMDSDNSLYQTINGSYPKNDNEICISSYTAETILNCKIYDSNGQLLELNSPEDIIGKSINISGSNYTITGIFESGALPEKYDILKTDEGKEDYRLQNLFESELSDGLQLIAFTTKSNIERINAYYGTKNNMRTYQKRLSYSPNFDGDFTLPEYANAFYISFDELSAETDIRFLNQNKTSLSENEAILSENAFYEFIVRYFEQMREKAYNEYEKQEASEYDEILEKCYHLMSGGVWSYNEEKNEETFTPFTAKEKEEEIAYIISKIDPDVDLNIASRLYNDSNGSLFGEQKEIKVVGFYVEPYSQNQETTLVLSDKTNTEFWNEHKSNLEYYEEYSTKYSHPANGVYNVIFLPFDHSEEQVNNFWEIYDNEEYEADDSRVKLSGMFIDRLEMVDSMVKSMSSVFLYVGLVLAVFAALLFSNFISVSISQKKKDIGILRAVGAKSTDVFKIFFSESAFIATICIIISTILNTVVCNFLNMEFAIDIGASLFVFGAPSFVVLVLIAVLTAIIATFLPVYSAAKKKPIESIRSI